MAPVIQPTGDSKFENLVDKTCKEDYALHPEQELRFEVEKGEYAKIQVLEGNAELFGTELIKQKPYFFNGGKGYGIFTWSSCKVRITGKTESAYISKDTPMVQYLNVSFAIEGLRRKAEERENQVDNQGNPLDARGPRVMVVGGTDVGKTTLCRLLLNYGVRLGRRPVFIDLDVGQQSIGIPGSIGALMVERPADPVEGFDMKAPIVYHYGHTTPNANFKLYSALITRIQDLYNNKCHYNQKVHHSGCIINTCGWVNRKGYDTLLETAKTFEADVVLCLDAERLYQDLVRDLPDFVNIMLLKKSPGVLTRSKEQRREAREALVREYYDGPRGQYYPHSFDVPFDNIDIFKIGTPSLPNSALPIGTTLGDTETKLMPVAPSSDIMNHILAVSRAETVEEELTETNVSGFVVVKAVDEERRVMTVKSPAPHPLIGRYMLLSTLRYMD